MVHKTQDHERMDLALVVLAGPALPWIQILRRRIPFITWEQFSHELLIRFGDDTTRDGYEAMAATQQHGTLADYIAAFEAHLAQLPNLTDRQFLGFFLAGLKPQLRAHLRDPSILCYSDAVQMAKRLDWVAGSHTPPEHPPHSGVPNYRPQTRYSTSHSPEQSHLPNSHHQDTTPAHSSSQPAKSTSDSSTNSRVRYIPPEEFQRHKEAGTCFCCGQCYSPSHRCPPKTLQVLIGGEEEEEEEQLASNEGGYTRSNGALFGLQLIGPDQDTSKGSRTMQLKGMVGARPVRITIESGASHCFIAEGTALRLGLPTTPAKPMVVQLGNGSRIRGGGLCQNVPLKLANTR